MKGAPVWSVIIPAWEAQETIGSCLRSLVAQRGAPEFEVLVVDSSTTAATRAVVEEMSPELPGLHYHPLQERAFPGVARNADAAQTKSPGVIGGSIGLRQTSSVSARLRHIFEFKESLPGVPLRPTWQLPTACLSISREGFLAAEGFPSLRASEDWLFNWRLWSAGTPMRLDPSLRVDHATADGWRDFARYARVLGHASGKARRMGGLPGQWLVRRPWLALLLPAGRTGRALVWCGRYSLANFLLLLWTWPAYFVLAAIWACEFRRGVLGLPPPRPER